MFELTDLWTPTLWVSDYLKFLSTLFMWVTRVIKDDDVGEVAAKAQPGDSGGLVMKSKKEVTHACP